MPETEAILRPTSRRILEALIGGRRSLTELSAATGLKKQSLAPYLRALAELGFLEHVTTSTPTGREVHYELLAGSLHLEVRPEAEAFIAWRSVGAVHHDFPLLSQIRDPGVRTEVLSTLAGLRARLTSYEGFWSEAFIVLFGSVARDEATWKSDIDLLFVTRSEERSRYEEAMLDGLAVLQDQLEHPTRAHFATREGFLRRPGVIEREAAREGMVLHDPWGESELWKAMGRYKRILL